jgi:hypothetical protein
MRRFVIIAALLGMSSTLPALASEQVQPVGRSDNQPVTLNDQQLDEVTAGDLLGLNLGNTLNALTTSLSSTLGGLGAGGTGTSGGLLGNVLQGPTSAVGGLLNTVTGLLGGLGL